MELSASKVGLAGTRLCRSPSSYCQPFTEVMIESGMAATICQTVRDECERYLARLPIILQRHSVSAGSITIRRCWILSVGLESLPQTHVGESSASCTVVAFDSEQLEFIVLTQLVVRYLDPRTSLNSRIVVSGTLPHQERAGLGFCLPFSRLNPHEEVKYAWINHAALPSNANFY